MRIIVPIKQVPETSNVKLDPLTGTMLRTAVEGIVNPLDLFALEAALQLRDIDGGIVTVITMGPPKAEAALRDALAMGCDDAILLSDRRFGGSDTWATAYTLGLAIQKLGHFDVVICGERATDGETGQVGPGIASFLDLPIATYVSRILETGEDYLRVERLVEDGREQIWSALPMVLTVQKEIGIPRLSSLRNKMLAQKTEIPIWGPEIIDAKEEWLGLKGSPTRVEKIYSPKLFRKGQVFTANSSAEIENAVKSCLQFLKDRGLTVLSPKSRNRE